MDYTDKRGKYYKPVKKISIECSIWTIIGNTPFNLRAKHMASNPKELSEPSPSGTSGRFQDNMAALQLYASATHTQVVQGMTELDVKDKAMDEMIGWCAGEQDIVVLKSGTILSADPTSRKVQNCKSVMLTKGVYPGQVFAATSSLIALLLATSEEEDEADKHVGETSITFSDQQKHLRELVNEAARRNVSDIHMQVRQTYTKVRMRQNGELHVYAEWSEKLGREIASVAFNKETDHATSHFNPLIPQDASMPLKIQGRDIRLRLASVPAHGGFDMVMRILATGEDKRPTLEALGYTANQTEIIKTAMALPFGAIIVAGPTGSGKTTTLASCMDMVAETAKLYSIEDPVEKVIEQATQVPVNTEKSDRSFAAMGRAALRMDPDVIVLGEMRDEETARIMVSASITGHLVLSTLHTNRATAIITRLMDMKVSPSLLSDSSVLRCLCCQRLAVKLCPHCCIPVKSSPQHQTLLQAWQEVLGQEIIEKARARGPGCPKCHHSGIGGRIVVAEVIYVDEEGRKFVLKGDSIGWEAYLKSNGWQNFYDRAIDLVAKGIIDPLDAEKVVGPINPATQAKNYMYK